MATQGITLAKNRIQVVQQKIIEGRIGDLSIDGFGEIMYYGKTTDATATELFIAGKAGASSEGTTYYNRLYLPESTVMFFDYTYLGYNATDDTFAGLQKGYGCVQNLNGTTAAAFDLNKSGATADLYIPLDFDATAGDLDLSHTGTNGTVSVVPTVDDTGDYLSFVVTGTAAKTIYHKLWVRCYTLNETECRGNFFFGDRAAQTTGV